MSRAEDRFREDRALRDAARAVFFADLDHAKANFSAKGVAERITGRIGDGAKDVFEVAKDQADDNRGIIAALIGAIVMWFGREPILEFLGLSTPDAPDEACDEPDTPDRTCDEKVGEVVAVPTPAEPQNDGATHDAPSPISGDDNERPNKPSSE